MQYGKALLSSSSLDAFLSFSISHNSPQKNTVLFESKNTGTSERRCFFNDSLAKALAEPSRFL